MKLALSIANYSLNLYILRFESSLNKLFRISIVNHSNIFHSGFIVASLSHKPNYFIMGRLFNKVVLYKKWKDE